MKKLYTLLASALLVVSASAGAPMQKTISANIDASVVDMSKAVITDRNLDHNALQARHNSLKKFRAQAADEPTLIEDSKIAGDYIAYTLGGLANDTIQGWSISMAQIEEYSDGTVAVYGLFDPDNIMIGMYDDAKSQLTLASFATTCPRTEQNALGQWVETDSVISVGAVSLQTGYSQNIVLDVDVDHHYLSWVASDNGVQYLDAVMVGIRHKDASEEDEEMDAIYFMNFNTGWNALVQFALIPNASNNQYNMWYIYEEHSDDLREINVSNVFGGFFIPSSPTNHNFNIQVSADLKTAVAEDQVAQSFSDGDYLLWNGDLDDTIVNFEVGNATLSGTPVGAIHTSAFAAAPLLNPEGDALVYYDPTLVFLDFIFDNSGVEAVSVADENAPVEYFNLQGVRVANPEAGLYIRRQGKNVSKVFVK